ncbi:hypothetical protein HDU85_002967 [Gaertneriomyces sp. JEL0708]|nr:hypothetical protein HDU85_002967 [Gaertneriomyces sp. JEL0708]
MVIQKRWQIMHLLGKGAFGEVHAALDLEKQQLVAIKIEPPTCKKQVLKLEINVIKKLQGSVRSISELRRKCAGGKFSISTTAMLGKQMLRAIESLHKIGVIHRDIKPGNFCIDLPKRNERPRCYLIDFGLSRKFVDTLGNIREARAKVGFRGTARYASLAAHQGKELGPVDDLWSLFYLMVEFLRGSLPWKGKEKEKIGELKQKYTNASLVSDLPSPMHSFYSYLTTLRYESTPDYEYIHSLVHSLLLLSGRPDNAPYDWEAYSGIGNDATWSDSVATGQAAKTSVAAVASVTGASIDDAAGKIGDGRRGGDRKGDSNSVESVEKGSSDAVEAIDNGQHMVLPTLPPPPMPSLPPLPGEHAKRTRSLLLPRPPAEPPTHRPPLFRSRRLRLSLG